MAEFYLYQESDYQDVRDFFLKIGGSSNWNWARWEWMYYHPYFDKDKEHTIGLWKSGEQIVGIATYDLFYGEAFCETLPDYKALLPELIRYAAEEFRDDNGIGFYALGEKAEILEQMGFRPQECQEVLSELSLQEELPYALGEDLAIRQVHFPEDNLRYQRVIWKGFDHEGDEAELQKMLRNSHRLPPNREERLCLSVEDGNGEFVAHCTCWYQEKTDYAYIEPVCVVPGFRGLGLGKAVVSEALNRCKDLGAKRAMVLSDSGFYQSLGFVAVQKYPLYLKRIWRPAIDSVEIWDGYLADGTLANRDLIRGAPIPEGLYHLVSDILVRHIDGDYLLMQRDFSKPNYGGFYEATAGGSALKGEDIRTCAKRELLEETGISAISQEEIGHYISRDTIYFQFLCLTDCEKTAVRCQPGETVAYRWVTEEEFVAFIHSGDMIPVQKIRYGDFLKNMGYL